MIVKLLTEHHLAFLNFKEAAEAHLSLHMSKCHIVGNLMSRHYYKLPGKYHFLLNITWLGFRIFFNIASAMVIYVSDLPWARVRFGPVQLASC